MKIFTLISNLLLSGIFIATLLSFRISAIDEHFLEYGNGIYIGARLFAFFASFSLVCILNAKTKSFFGFYLSCAAGFLLTVFAALVLNFILENPIGAITGFARSIAMIVAALGAIFYFFPPDFLFCWENEKKEAV